MSYGGHALVPALECAVPLWIERLRMLPWSKIQAIAAEAGEAVAHRGDVILYGAHGGTKKKKVEVAAGFNALARGVACVAFLPGGVDVFGLHFEAHRATEAELEQMYRGAGWDAGEAREMAKDWAGR